MGDMHGAWGEWCQLEEGLGVIRTSHSRVSS